MIYKINKICIVQLSFRYFVRLSLIVFIVPVSASFVFRYIIKLIIINLQFFLKASTRRKTSLSHKCSFSYLVKYYIILRLLE